MVYPFPFATYNVHQKSSPNIWRTVVLNAMQSYFFLGLKEDFEVVCHTLCYPLTKNCLDYRCTQMPRSSMVYLLKKQQIQEIPTNYIKLD